MQHLFTSLILFSFVFLPFSSLEAKGKPKNTAPKSKEKSPSAERFEQAEKRQKTSLEIQAKKMKLDGEKQRSSRNKSGNARMVITSCPVCESQFYAWNISRQPPEKGMDRDFCKHAKNPSAYDFDIWYCSRCGYANFKTNFAQPVSDTIKKKVEEEGTPLLAKLFRDIYQLNVLKLDYSLDQEDLPTAAKYALMRIYINDLDFSHKLKAKFYLMNAYVERTRFVTSLTDPTLVAVSSKISERYHQFIRDRKENQASLAKVKNEHVNFDKMKNFKKSENFDPWIILEFLRTLDEAKMSNEEKLLLYTHKAKQWDRLGFRLAANEELKKATKLSLTPRQQKLVKFRRIILNHEYKMLNQALIEIKKAMRNDEYKQDELPQFIYLLAELYRRIGLYDESKLWFELSMKMKGPNTKIFANWAKEQTELLPKEIPNKAPDFEVIFVSKVARQLNDGQLGKSTDLPSLKNNEEIVHSWLRIINTATKNYFDKYEIDPKNIQELIDEGFLKHNPDVEKVATRFFDLEVNRRKALEERYTIISRLPYPYKKSKGYYYPAINGDAIIKKALD